MDTHDWHAIAGDVLNTERPYGIVQYLSLEECREIDGDDATFPSRTVVIAEVTEADTPEQTKADAELLAAAPKLLGALAGLFQHCVMVHKHWGDGDNAAEARAAIDNASALLARMGG